MPTSEVRSATWRIYCKNRKSDLNSKQNMTDDDTSRPYRHHNSCRPTYSLGSTSTKLSTLKTLVMKGSYPTHPGRSAWQKMGLARAEGVANFHDQGRNMDSLVRPGGKGGGGPLTFGTGVLKMEGLGGVEQR